MSESLAKQETDQSVESRAQSALLSCPFNALRELRVEQEGGRLLISGRVSSFYHKQVAQELVRAVAGDMPVVNAVAVD